MRTKATIALKFKINNHACVHGAKEEPTKEQTNDQQSTIENDTCTRHCAHKKST